MATMCTSSSSSTSSTSIYELNKELVLVINPGIKDYQGFTDMLTNIINSLLGNRVGDFQFSESIIAGSAVTINIAEPVVSINHVVLLHELNRFIDGIYCGVIALLADVQTTHWLLLALQ
ncbi:hypothetical protein AAHE18_16G062200 [Arachis hypogaea]